MGQSLYDDCVDNKRIVCRKCSICAYPEEIKKPLTGNMTFREHTDKPAMPENDFGQPKARARAPNFL